MLFVNEFPRQINILPKALSKRCFFTLLLRKMLISTRKFVILNESNLVYR